MPDTAVVLHDSLNPTGGGEKLALETICVLKELGFRVHLVTREPTDWPRVARILGGGCRPDKEYSVNIRLRRFRLYTRVARYILALPRIKRALITVNTHGDVLPFTADIVYMHFPSAFITKTMNPIMAKYRNKVLWRMYALPYETIERLLLWRMRGSLVLTNSSFSRNMIKQVLGLEARILYPPVDVELFMAPSSGMRREDIVVSCGRFHPSKRFEIVLRVAEELPDIDFYIIGSSSGDFSRRYLGRLRGIIEERRLRNVKLLVDTPRKIQVELYHRAKVYVHPMMYEHFGIAVVEAMAGGLVPIVHMSGGPYYDIIERGRYGLYFHEEDELPEKILYALRHYDELSQLAVRRSKAFSKEKFREGMRRAIEEVLDRKKRR